MQKSLTLYPIYRFNSLASTWEEFQMKDIPSVIFPKPNLKFITYNVWFEDFDFEERADELSKILENSNPDFICLQEVTNKFVEILIAKPFVMKDYYVSLTKPFYGYTVMILAKYPFGLYNIPYPTEMGRSLLVAASRIGGDKTFAVATSHFESLNQNEPYRAKQMAIAFEFLKKFDFACLMGDFNCDNAREDAKIDKEFQDLWRVLKDMRTEPGHTMPATPYFSAWRPDKFLLKSHPNLQGRTIEIIGTIPIPKYCNPQPKKEEIKIPPNQNPKDFIKKSLNIDVKSSNVNTPSDHYGLEVLLEFV